MVVDPIRGPDPEVRPDFTQRRRIAAPTYGLGDELENFPLAIRQDVAIIVAN